MTLKEAHETLVRAYGVRIEGNKVVAFATSDLPYVDDNLVFEAWQVLADRLYD